MDIDSMTASESSSSHADSLRVEGVEIDASPSEPGEGGATRKIAFRGRITSRQPDAQIQPFLRKIHDAAKAAQLSRVDVDVTELSFVNSSGIRLFVDWAMWAAEHKPGGYRLRFLTKEGVTWQRMTLAALTSIAPGVVDVVVA
jgi:hypothetical protein